MYPNRRLVRLLKFVDAICGGIGSTALQICCSLTFIHSVHERRAHSVAGALVFTDNSLTIPRTTCNSSRQSDLVTVLHTVQFGWLWFDFDGSGLLTTLELSRTGSERLVMDGSRLGPV